MDQNSFGMHILHVIRSPSHSLLDQNSYHRVSQSDSGIHRAQMRTVPDNQMKIPDFAIGGSTLDCENWFKVESH